jgi:subtilisin family serine protease
MARYVLASRRAGMFSERDKGPARAAADRAISTLAVNVDMVGTLDPPDPLARQVSVFDADPDEIAAQRGTFGPDVMIEREILHYPKSVVLPVDLTRDDGSPAAGTTLAGAGSSLRLTVTGDDGQPIANAAVHLGLRAANQSNELVQVTDDAGQASFTFSSFWTPAAAVVVPAGGHWTMVSRGPRDGDTIVAPQLPDLGPIGWWHTVLGIDEVGLGAGIRVGVADTGCGPHPDLAHCTGLGSFLEGNRNPDPVATIDVDMHGTHVCGTIGARPTEAARPAGIANGADLFCARIFPGPDTGANQGDIANAVDALSREAGTDLINLSIGAPQGSEIVRDALQDALERGTLCVCAAGNSNGPVEFPGAFDEAVAISALGREGWGPPGSLASIRTPSLRDRFGVDGLYLANFSCFGEEVDATAPGVGIIATVPERFGLLAPLGAMDGTSMASPAACATLAAALSADADYLALPRDTTRSSHARIILKQAARHVGLAAVYEGSGAPQG